MQPKTVLLVTLALGAAAAAAAFRTYPLNPRWPLAGGFHYVVDLNTTSFPPSSVWDQNAQWSLSDWRDIGSTGFTPGFRRSAANPFVNNDNISAWGWSNQPGQSWLGITYYRHQAPNILEADVVFNSRPDYPWTNGLTDPCKDHGYTPYNFRTVAVHETGHALGLDHENAFLAQMNPIYERHGIPHSGASGELPHADDKFGCRFLYPAPVPATIYNLMATCWRPNASGQPTRIPFGNTTHVAGTNITVPVYIENQTNGSFAAAPTRLGIYLSTNDVITTADTRIADITFSGSWSAHGEASYAFPVQIPLGTTGGIWHVGAIIDWTNALAERYENDNAARLGTITVLEAKPDLVMDAITVTPVKPVRGGDITISTTVRNIGSAPAPATSTYFFLQDAVVTPEPGRHFTLTSVRHGVIPANGAVQILLPQTPVPASICAERIFYIRGEADINDEVKESNETNNWRALGFQAAWESTPGFKIGQMQGEIQSFSNLKVGLCTAVTGRQIPSTTWYYLLMTCSGTSPGIPLPPFGTLPLNYDLCTDIGIALEGSIFLNMRGKQTTAIAGELGELLSGNHWAPLSGFPVDFAGLYLDPTAQQIVGIAPSPVRVYVR